MYGVEGKDCNKMERYLNYTELNFNIFNSTALNSGKEQFYLACRIIVAIKYTRTFGNYTGVKGVTLWRCNTDFIES